MILNWKTWIRPLPKPFVPPRYIALSRHFDLILTILWPDCGVKNFDCRIGQGGLYSKNPYIGEVDTTKSGERCQNWSVQRPHKHGRAMGDHNYCRNPNPGERDRPWCLTNNDKKRHDYCEIRNCEECDAGNYQKVIKAFSLSFISPACQAIQSMSFNCFLHAQE